MKELEMCQLFEVADRPLMGKLNRRGTEELLCGVEPRQHHACLPNCGKVPWQTSPGQARAVD
jgi:hypothetical protein